MKKERTPITPKNENTVSEPQAIYKAKTSVSAEKTYTHEEVFGNLKKRLKEFYGEI